MNLFERLEKRVEAGGSLARLLLWAALLLGAGVIIGAVWILLLLGMWPFLKIGDWLLG